MPHGPQVAALLDAATSDHRLLDHPFYKAWASGSLVLEDLAYYSTQYWRQVEAFPGYLETLAGRLPASEARRVVADNLRDERDDDHPGLWIDFAAAVGAARDELERTSAEPETARCIDDFAAAAATGSPAYALGMLYGYESQTPAVAATKADGLRRHYGIDGAGIAYFELHGELDVHHSAALADAIADAANDDEGLADAADGAKAGARAIWGLLDGVARVRAIPSC